MLALKEFQIPYVGLTLGEHEYSFNIRKKFFSCFENSEIATGDMKCRLVLEKKSDMLVLNFFVSGYVDLQCDRCLGDYPQEVKLDNRLIIKFGGEYVEQTDEIIIIPDTQQEINVSQYVFEFIHLALPAKKIHPGGVGDRMNCDEDMLRKLEDHSHGGNQDNNKGHDSRWDDLKNIKFD